MGAYADNPDLVTLLLRNHTWNISYDTCFNVVHQMSGTSMAAPMVAGLALLIMQYFMSSNDWSAISSNYPVQFTRGSFTPSGYLLKATIIHSARALKTYSNEAYDNSSSSYFRSFRLSKPPDIFQGFGSPVLQNLLPLLDDNKEKRQSSNTSLYVFDKIALKSFSQWRAYVEYLENTDTSSQVLVATLCWYDPPALMGMAMSLLVDNLIVRTPAGNYFVGNKGRYGKSQIPIESDNINTCEKIEINSIRCVSNATKCRYEVFIKSGKLQNEIPQEFALVITTSGTTTLNANIVNSFNATLYIMIKCFLQEIL